MNGEYISHPLIWGLRVADERESYPSLYRVLILPGYKGKYVCMYSKFMHAQVKYENFNLASGIQYATISPRNCKNMALVLVECTALVPLL